MADRSEDGVSGPAALSTAYALYAIAINQDALKGERLDAVFEILKCVARGQEVLPEWRHLSADVATFLVAVIDDGANTQDRRFQAAHCLMSGAERGWWRVPTRFL